MQPAPNIDHLLSNIGRTGLPGEASGERTLLFALTLNAAFSLKVEVGKSLLALHCCVIASYYFSLETVKCFLKMVKHIQSFLMVKKKTTLANRELFKCKKCVYYFQK